MMRFGIIGLPQAGETTVFNALTGRDQPTVRSRGRLDVHLAVVDVPDPRVDRLSELFKPRKTTYARVIYADIAGLEGAAEQGEISGVLLSQLAQMDGFVHVVRCFESPSVSHPAGAIHTDLKKGFIRAEVIGDEELIALGGLSEARKRGKLRLEGKDYIVQDGDDVPVRFNV